MTPAVWGAVALWSAWCLLKLAERGAEIAEFARGIHIQLADGVALDPLAAMARCALLGGAAVVYLLGIMSAGSVAVSFAALPYANYPIWGIRPPYRVIQ